jgi:hypothetical protein
MMYSRDAGAVVRRLAVVALCIPCHALTFTEVTYPVPATERRSGKEVKLSGDGLYAAFQSDSDFGATGLATHAYQVHNVWMRDLGTGGGFTLLSNASKPSDLDAKYVDLDRTGAHACYSSQVPGEESVMKWTGSSASITRITSMPKKPETNLQSPLGKRDLASASRCDISADGSCIVFASDAQLADLNGTHKCAIGAQNQGCVEVGYGKDQVYLTCDDGASFTMVTPASLATSSKAQGAVLSGDGKFVAFRSSSELINNTVVSGKDEAYMYEVATKKLAKVSAFGEACDLGVVYNKLVELHGEGALKNASVTKGSRTSCQWAAAQGHIPSKGTMGLMIDSPTISESGRFLAYTTDFAAADTRGTHDMDVLVSSTHLFLFDAHLGMTWQVTKEGFPGEAHNKMVEDFCCPGASSNYKRGKCEDYRDGKYALQGQCCWQKPCFFFVLNPEISGDGNSIVLIADYDHSGDGNHEWKRLQVYHYYIPTSTFTRITNTSDDSLDQLDPSISYAGDRVAFGSDYDFFNQTSVLDRNQIYLAEIAMGCSGNADATNYLAAPDVETCCTWSADIEPHTAGAATEKVTLSFSLVQSAMIARVPFANVDSAAFCGRLAEQVKSDVACALDIPPSLITVDKGTAACGWASDSNKAVTVELTLHQRCLGSAAGLAAPADLAQEIVRQHSNPKSRIWRGYLTKTLDDDTAPVVTSVLPRRRRTRRAPRSRLRQHHHRRRPPTRPLTHPLPRSPMILWLKRALRRSARRFLSYQ